MFLDVNGELHRIVKQEAAGAWVISYNNPGPPQFVLQAELDTYPRVATPEDSYQSAKKEQLSEAEQERLELIQPLLDDEQCIKDRFHRGDVARETAALYETTSRRILQLYYRYLATGILIRKKELKSRGRFTEEFKWAVNTFYFSAKKKSLKDAYDLMLLQRFTTPEGRLMEDYPTYSAFKHFFYRNRYDKSSQKVIARDGLTNFQRTARPLFGSAMAWKSRIGAYQMDATAADIYLVSRLDRTKVVGRPYVYLAVDTATQLIAGLYVGYDAGEEAVMACLANAAMDKVAYCKGFGVDIDPMDWPSAGLPGEVIIDQGRDFKSGRMQELCLRYGLTYETLPPFRPDEKGLVEKMFDLIQNRYKPILRGRGIIEEDAQERWAVDYRLQASLDLTQFTEVIIHCIVFLNCRRVLDNYQMSQEMREQGVSPTASGLWRYYVGAGKSSLMEIDEKEVYYMTLPRINGRLTRRGIAYNHFLYINREFMSGEQGQRYFGQEITFAYDEQSVSSIYLILDGLYIPFDLAPQFSIYGGAAKAESELLWQEDRRSKREHKRKEDEGRVELARKIAAIKNEAVPEEKEFQNGETIKQNRMKERDRRK